MLQGRTIRDFGAQWRRYQDNTGYYGSVDMLADILGPLLPLDAFHGARVADIGSGTGRIVSMLVAVGASEVVAVEPSAGFEILKKNTAKIRDRLRYIKGTGEAVAQERDLDFVVSIGVLHHIVDPLPLAKAAFRALRPGGHFIVWLYGKEGNEAYLRIVVPLRRVTRILPHPLLSAFCSVLNVILDIYIFLCHRTSLNLPLKGHITNVFGKLTREQRWLGIYDQLNPAFSKYYSREEATNLFRAAGFKNPKLHNRHGYSWTVIGTKPLEAG